MKKIGSVLFALAVLLAPGHAMAQGKIQIVAGPGCFGPQGQSLMVGTSDGWKFNMNYATLNSFALAANIFSQNDVQWVGLQFSSLNPIGIGTYQFSPQGGQYALQMNWNGVSPADSLYTVNMQQYSFDDSGPHIALDIIGNNWFESLRFNSSFQITPVPEPETNIILGLGVLGMVGVKYWLRMVNKCFQLQKAPVRSAYQQFEKRR